MVGGPSIVFKIKAVIDKTFIRNSESICKSIVGIDASQLFLILCASPCQQDYTPDEIMT